MALTKIQPNIIAVANNVTNKTVGNTTSIPSFTFDGSGVVTSASNVAISGAGITANTVANSAFQTGSVENYLRGANLDFGMRNRIINGAMVIDQRNAGAAFNNTTSGVYSADRWKTYGAQSAKFSIQQDSSANTVAGFTSSLKVTSLSSYSLVTSDQFDVYQLIEGYNIADLAWGTASAKTITLSFWTRSSLTGTFGGSVRNTSANRSYPFTYTINAANTWEYKTITIPGETTGTWEKTTSTGIILLFGLGTHSGLSGPAGAWASTNYVSATGATSIVGTNAATWYVTGVQLEAGSSPTPFEYRQYGTELQLCQRYYYLWVKGNASTTQEMGMGFYLNNTEVDVKVYLPVSMRTNPSLSQVTGTNYYRFTRSGGSDDFDSLTLERCNASNSIISLYNDTQMSGTGGVAGNMLSFNAAAFMSFTAEL